MDISIGEAGDAGDGDDGAGGGIAGLMNRSDGRWPDRGWCTFHNINKQTNNKQILYILNFSNV